MADGGHHLMDRQVVVRHRVVHEAEPERARDAVTQVPDVALEGVQRQEKRLGALIDHGATVGQFEPAAPAPAQAEAEPILQGFHMEADGRLAETESHLRAEEAAMFHDRAEHGERAKVGLGDLHGRYIRIVDVKAIPFLFFGSKGRDL